MAKQCGLPATHTRAVMSLFNHCLVHQNLNRSFAFAPIHPHSKGLKMKYFGINYFCNHKHHADAIWANDRYELEKQILTMHPNATAIYIWLL
jgi:hypothetical protein